MRVDFYEPSGAIIGAQVPKLIFSLDLPTPPNVGEVITRRGNVYQIVARGWEAMDGPVLTNKGGEPRNPSAVVACVINCLGRNTTDFPAVAGQVSGHNPAPGRTM